MERTDMIKKKKAMLEALDDIFERISYSKKDLVEDYRRTGEKQQKTSYNKETKEYDPVFDEEGNPVMEDVWDYVTIPESELSEDKKAKLAAYTEIEKTLEKLI